MLALAIVVLALVLFLVVVSFVGSSQEVIIDFANVTITTSSGGVFVAGVVAGLVALASLVALRISLRGLWNRRKEVQELRRQAGVSGEPGQVGRTTVEPRRTGTEDTEESAPAQPTKEEPAREHAEQSATDTTDQTRRSGEGARRDNTERPSDEPRS